MDEIASQNLQEDQNQVIEDFINEEGEEKNQQNVLNSSILLNTEKVADLKTNKSNQFQLNLDLGDQSSDSSPQRSKDKSKKKRRNTINLMSSEEDFSINFQEYSEIKQQIDTDQFVLQGLSSQEIEKSNKGSIELSKKLSGNSNRDQKGKFGGDNLVFKEDDEAFFKRKENLNISQDIDEEKLELMRKELSYQLFENKHLDLFTRSKGKLSVDIKDLEEDEEEGEDQDKNSDFLKEQKQENFFKNSKLNLGELKLYNHNYQQGNFYNWADFQVFISSTGSFLINEKKQISKLLHKLESCYNENIMSNLQFREQFQTRKDYSLESKQYVPIILDTKYQIFRVDNSLKVNLSIAKDYICENLKYIQMNPSLLAQVVSSLSSYRDFEINDFIENINNFLFDNILDYQPIQKPLYKFLSEIIKKEINNAKKIQDTFKMDSIYMKFIQGFTKRTNFQIFFSESFKIPLYSIIKYNKIIKIDPAKINSEDLNIKKPQQNNYHHHHHHYNQHHQNLNNQNSVINLHHSQPIQMNQSLNSSSIGGNTTEFRHTHDVVLKINQSQDQDNRTSIPQVQANRNTGFLNSFFSLFSSTESKKKRKDSNNTLNESTILQQGPPTLQYQNSSCSCNNIDSIEDNSVNLNSQESAMTKSIENSVIDETEEDRALIEERKKKEVENNILVLKQITTQIIDALTKHISCIPKGIKIMCKMIVILLAQKDPTLSLEERLQVLSQFIIMRWVVPSLVSLLHRNTLTELHQVRYQNISTITKVLQKIFKKEYENLNDNPGHDILRPFIMSFSERIDKFYDYLLNFDGGFIEDIINKTDKELYSLKEDTITSLSLSYSDVDLIHKIFSSVQDDKIKSQHKKLFTQVEKCIKFNEAEKFLDNTIKSQQNTLFYIWRPAEFYTQNLVDKCLKFPIQNKNDAEHVTKQKLINTLIQFFQKINPNEDFIENTNSQELQGILNFYGRKNQMSQKVMQNGLQLKIQSNFIKSLLKKFSPDYEGNSFQSLLQEIHTEVSEKRQNVVDQIKYIKYKIQQAISKLTSQTLQIKKENQEMLERTIKQNILLFIKKADIPVRIIYQDDCKIMIEKEQDEQQFKEAYSFYRESLQVGYDQVKQKMKKKSVNLNENDIICKNIKEFIESMHQKRIFDKLIDFYPQNIKQFRKQINNYNDYIVEKFFNMPKMQQSNRMAIYEQVQIQFEKYLARALAKKYLMKKEQYNVICSPKHSGNRKISIIDKMKHNSGKKTYDDIHLASLTPKLEKIQKQSNHVDILYIIDECVDQLRDLAELNGQDKNEELIIVSKMSSLIEKSQIHDCQMIIKIIDSLINLNFWNKKVKIIQSLTIFKLAVNEVASM
ncbi:GTPase-activator protein for Ras-like GTPase (macronuclear) [Tetrahymena thermophila SB210]|uniref:GTPase-activator protein for Ras-like GTPase n=1 Tax=Tetrahymena thermophila (strain SB210) TaxID=312017 RepID=Q23AF6_TETTS|nr:GTPase-activator protein for Ras-like GTPase [Tetrahymena thermophila SB210]EAR93536.3 GTPase-activator protein for Ras-like GTPase [Tetrahymena thermophila SB210]|eukprot:XP_001013781.3 GTPase-activator protein for Ras-like GTPase [Tetrahymena thermophila SB210]